MYAKISLQQTLAITTTHYNVKTGVRRFVQTSYACDMDWNMPASVPVIKLSSLSLVEKSPYYSNIALITVTSLLLCPGHSHSAGSVCSLGRWTLPVGGSGFLQLWRSDALHTQHDVTAMAVRFSMFGVLYSLHLNMTSQMWHTGYPVLGRYSGLVGLGLWCFL